MSDVMSDLMKLEMDRCRFERNMQRHDDEMIKFYDRFESTAGTIAGTKRNDERNETET